MNPGVCASTISRSFPLADSKSAEDSLRDLQLALRRLLAAASRPAYQQADRDSCGKNQEDEPAEVVEAGDQVSNLPAQHTKSIALVRLTLLLSEGAD